MRASPSEISPEDKDAEGLEPLLARGIANPGGRAVASGGEGRPPDDEGADEVEGRVDEGCYEGDGVGEQDGSAFGGEEEDVDENVHFETEGRASRSRMSRGWQKKEGDERTVEHKLVPLLPRLLLLFRTQLLRQKRLALPSDTRGRIQRTAPLERRVSVLP